MLDFEMIIYVAIYLPRRERYLESLASGRVTDEVAGRYKAYSKS